MCKLPHLPHFPPPMRAAFEVVGAAIELSHCEVSDSCDALQGGSATDKKRPRTCRGSVVKGFCQAAGLSSALRVDSLARNVLCLGLRRTRLSFLVCSAMQNVVLWFGTESWAFTGA